MSREQQRQKSRISIAVKLLLLISMAFTSIDHAQANPTKEFIMACTYGVLAGTLVGAATLAFTKNPGENLNKVARGASLGLYGGILLGVYVVYIVPGQIEKENQDILDQNLPGQGSLFRKVPPVVILPLEENGRLAGAYAGAEVFRF